MRRSTLLLAGLVLAADSRSARAVPLPEVMAELGRSFAVDSPVEGVFDQGGISVALSALWPVEDRLRFGVSLFADEMGSQMTELVDDSQNPPVSLGVFDLAHVNVYGGAWRLEAVGPRLRRLSTFARGDFGFYRFRADQNGDDLGGATKVGWGLGGGAMLPVRENHAVGVTLSFDRVFYDDTRDYMSAALAWHWRPGFRQNPLRRES